MSSKLWGGDRNTHRTCLDFGNAKQLSQELAFWIQTASGDWFISEMVFCFTLISYSFGEFNLQYQKRYLFLDLWWRVRHVSEAQAQTWRSHSFSLCMRKLNFPALPEEACTENAPSAKIFDNYKDIFKPLEALFSMGYQNWNPPTIIVPQICLASRRICFLYSCKSKQIGVEWVLFFHFLHHYQS